MKPTLGSLAVSIICLLVTVFKYAAEAREPQQSPTLVDQLRHNFLLLEDSLWLSVLEAVENEADLNYRPEVELIKRFAEFDDRIQEVL